MIKSILQYLFVLHHQSCTISYSSRHDLLIQRGGLCPWPTFHPWVAMVIKKWLSLYYSTYWCYIHQTCTNCSSWHDLLMPSCGLCPWPTFTLLSDHGLEEMDKSELQYLLVLHSPNCHQLFILTWSADTTCLFVSVTYIPHLSDHG